jgi:transcriptional activator SPT7
MQKLGQTFSTFHNAPKVPVAVETPDGVKTEWKAPFSMEETILHTLDENGTDLESLETYVNEDIDRQGNKLGVMHTRMKAHLADLLRPALVDAGPDGSNAFNDGSEQFVGGDFAEDLGEDFFGFKELGLDKELGMFTLGVPLHLLQNKLHNASAAQNLKYASPPFCKSLWLTSSSAVSTSTSLFAPPPAYPAITVPLIKSQIGLVQNFFLAKLHANNDEPLIEDDDLPVKQRVAKPRLPANGKITSPLKRPADGRPGAQANGANAGSAKKKLKTGKTGPGVPGPGAGDKDNEGSNRDMPNGIPAGKVGPLSNPVGKLKLNLPNNVNTTANGLDGSMDIVKTNPVSNSSASAENVNGVAAMNGVSSSKVNGAAASHETGGEGGPVRGTSAREGSNGLMMSPESINGHL